jgi:hypothetical protein
MGDDRNDLLDEELLNNKRCVARCVIVMQKPLSLPATCRAASSDLHNATSSRLARRNDQQRSVQSILRISGTF